MDEALLPSQSARLAPLQVPRLGIIHLLAWTTVTAVLLSSGQHTVVGAATRDSVSGTILWSQAILYITRTALSAAATVASATVLRAWWTRGGAWAPGHALALIHMLKVGCFLIVMAIFEPQLRSFASLDELRWFYRVVAVVEFLSLVAYGAFAARSTFQRRWRITFWLYAAVSSIWGVMAAAMSIGGDFPEIFAAEGMRIVNATGFAIMLVALGISVMGDIARHQPRDWAHWVGALSLGILLLLSLGALFL